MIDKLKKFFLQHILRRKYIRKGSCNGCGSCCRQIYVKHAKFVLKSKEHFELLQKKHRFYRDLVHIDQDDVGLIFACKNLDLETNKCKIHKIRPQICREYPREELFMLGGSIAETCGFSFDPMVAFEDVLKKVSKARNKRGQ